jgi:TP901 family phage tail tape measure protein
MAKDEKAIIEVILKGQAANASLKEMQAAARALRAELSRMPADSDKFTQKSKEFQNLNSRIKNTTNELNGMGSAFLSLNKVIGGFVAANVITGGISKIIAKFSEAITVQKEFEKSLQNLSAITGASGKDLEFYSKKAQELGNNVEGGAKAVIEAYKLIGSAKPELLNNAFAMNQVTEAAILLSQASGLELPEAATRLTDAMNQFGAPAREAAKYVDALASAAKYGAAEVPDVTEALLRFGTAAKSSNIDIYESAAAIELLAEKGIKGADAGTALRNIFAKLSSADVLPERASEMLAQAGVNIQILKDKTIPLNERLLELSKIAGNASAITKTFGLENKIAGEVLITNLPRLAELNTQMKITGIANEQASKNTDTFSQATLRATNAWNNFTLGLTNGKTSGLFKGIIEGWTTSLENFAQYLNGSRGLHIQADAILSQNVRTGSRVTEKQAMNLASAGLDIGSGKSISENQKMIIGLAQAYDSYLQVLSKSNNYNQDSIAVLNSLDKSNKQLKAQYDSGKLSLQDYNIALRLLLNTSKQIETGNKDGINKNGTVSTPAVQLGIIAKLQKEIEDLVAKRITATSTLEIADYNKQIKNKQEYLDILLGKESEYARKLKDKHRQLMDELKKIEEENRTQGMADWAAENIKLMDAEKELTAKIKADGIMSAKEKEEAIFLVHQTTNRKITANNKKALDETAKEEAEHLAEEAEHLAEYTKLTNDEIMNELQAVEDKYAKQLEYYKADKEKTIELEKAKKKEIDAIWGKSDTKTGKAETKKSSSKQGEIINDVLNYYAVLESVGQAYFQMQANNRSIEQAALDAKYDKDLAREQKLLDQKIISQTQYDKRVAKLEAEKTNRQRQFNQEEYKREKQAARYNTIIAGIEGIARIWAVDAPNPVKAGILTGILAAGTAARLAMINAQKPPTFAMGGLTTPGGMVNSSTLFGSSSGRPFIAGEAGSEWVAPNWMLQNPITANTIGMLEAMRSNRTFASGGSTGSMASSSNKVSSSGTSAKNSNDLTTILSRLADHLDNGIGVNYDLLTKASASVENAKRLSRV